MGKKHDRLYVSATEHSGVHGAHGAFHGRTAGGGGALVSTGEDGGTRVLPFDTCALSLQPFKDPVLDRRDGTCFERTRLVPWLKVYGINPVSGEPLRPVGDGNLVGVRFWRNEQGEYHCPITFKVFNQNSHIVVIIPGRAAALEEDDDTSARQVDCNVFSYEAVDKLNIKAKFWRELLNDRPFGQDDIVTIQDPLHRDRLNRDMSQFYYLRKAMDVPDPDNVKEAPSVNLKVLGGAARLLDQVSPAVQAPEKRATPKHLQSNISTGRTAASLTSTATPVSTKAERAIYDPLEVMFEDFREGRAFPSSASAAKEGQVHPAKTYVRLLTSLGDLNLELHSDKVPKTVWNFVTLSKQYYNGIPFHRNIPGFMIQGGSNPEGSGRGGRSGFKDGAPFEDELTGRAKELDGHARRGVVSMANSGPNSNKSQFFMTYGPTKHLDGKHTVFGQVVGGFDILDRMESFPTHSKDNRPHAPGILLHGVEILINPFEKYEERMRRRQDREEAVQAGKTAHTTAREKKEEDRLTWLGTELTQPHQSKQSPLLEQRNGPRPIIGRYLKKEPVEKDDLESDQARKKFKVNGSGAFGDFSNW